MYFTDEKRTNDSLLHHSTQGEIDSTLDAITVNRPLKNIDEATFVAEEVSTLLTFIEFSSQVDDEKLLDIHSQVEIWRGFEQISGIARLLSLRVEQYLTLRQHGEVKI